MGACVGISMEWRVCADTIAAHVQWQWGGSSCLVLVLVLVLLVCGRVPC